MKFVEKAVFVHIFVLGLVFALFVPPLQKPDEHGHFKRAYYLSRGYIFLFNDGKKLPLDRQLNTLVNDKELNRLPNHANRKLSRLPNVLPVFAPPDAFVPVFQSEKLMFIMGPVAYLPHAAGILLARLLHLNAVLTFYSGRMAIFLFSLTIMIWLYRRTAKPYRYVILFVYALPMTVHQMTAYGYDAVHYLLGFYIFSRLTQMIGSKHVSGRDLATFGLGMVLFLASKLSYEPLLLTVCIIPWKKISGSLKQYFAIITVWIALVLFAYFLLTWPAYVSSMTYTGHPPGVNPGRQVQYILDHPLSYAVNFAVSSWNLKKFHLQGVIGIFGWLDYSLDWWMYAVYLFIAGSLVYRLSVPAPDKLPTFNTAALAVILFLGYAFIMTVFYLNWKVVAAAQIDGTQGRYFTVFLPFIFYLLLQTKVWTAKT